ncbi:N-acetylmuramic acid 6-phosphate etherase [Propionispora sp. 2/2-37]|uniref:N-acetylmuramic acid 6-phosphate etherase n=1 Tax=Propionispora sp. 2/2-37 TaxID=1677858 RepID=UPI0006BB84C7|nr:N-acetylmuramic acid 6-phosphate etherase [Propionispora sp. 2/2-37]CUH95591.1 N-acetylmuramic acid 6-phosphate etherase [Propionispora sp. 2/2-37]
MKERNKDTIYIDEVSTVDMVRMFNNEDKKVAVAVEKCLDRIAEAIDLIGETLRLNGRLIYIGSGSGGKIGILDATECPPTFGVQDETVIGIISGGLEALSGWREETEDDQELAVTDLKQRSLSSSDIVVAISASGNTPYVLSAVQYAKQVGARTIGLCCSPGGNLENITDLCISVDVGPEVIMGSTRLKAGTAQKMILNMLSSGSMIKLGKTYGNLMVDVIPINNKLRRRVLDIVKIATAKEEQEVVAALEKAGGSTKVAILMLLLGIDAVEARTVLDQNGGFLKKAVRDKDESNC